MTLTNRINPFYSTEKTPLGDVSVTDIDKSQSIDKFEILKRLESLNDLMGERLNF